tara:strand:- start:138 stop:524 length:387 start_codon:yes stop_codon:yes gene_type:complete
MFAPFLQKHAAKSPTSLRAVSWALGVFNIRIISLILISLILSSCVSTVAHIESNSNNCPYNLYAGTRVNSAGIFDIFSGNNKGGNGAELVFIIDFPLSLIGDTFLAPYYLVSDHGENNSELPECNFNP